jgi:hypothetical protein
MKTDPKAPASLSERPNVSELWNRFTKDAVIPLSAYTMKINTEK